MRIDHEKAKLLAPVLENDIYEYCVGYKKKRRADKYFVSDCLIYITELEYVFYMVLKQSLFEVNYELFMDTFLGVDSKNVESRKTVCIEMLEIYKCRSICLFSHLKKLLSTFFAQCAEEVGVFFVGGSVSGAYVVDDTEDRELFAIIAEFNETYISPLLSKLLWLIDRTN